MCLSLSLSLCVCVCVCVFIYIYIYIYTKRVAHRTLSTDLALKFQMRAAVSTIAAENKMASFYYSSQTVYNTKGTDGL